MLRVFLVFLSLRLSFPLPVALLPPHRAASSRSVSRGRQGGNRRSVSLSGKSPLLSRRGPARRVRLHLIDADVYVGTASWGGEVLFRFASLSSFPLILFCLALCAIIGCNCTRGVLALCVQYFVDASALRRSLKRCRRGQRVGVGATAENTGATARKRGAFCTASPVRLRERSTSRAVEPCRRRARESADSARRERDECRAKT